MSEPVSLSDLDLLVIERACERLVYEFFEAIDTRNERHLEQLFIADCTYARPIEPNTIIQGIGNVVQAFAARPPRATRHICSNVRITVESATRARGNHRVVLISGPTEPGAHPQLGFKADARQLIGEFNDEFVKTAEGWRFASRRGRVILHT
ncbi:MAG TPA: nuclear transport factor 2 family protein [Steroidobacteraceae bacterium]|nr:nuclear transport factor 2 family protein [Steroidobacteraceae bacterium]